VAAVGLFAASPALAGADQVRASGELVQYSPLVPVGATARVLVVYDTAGDTTVTLRVRGLRPRTRYGAHTHAAPCSTTGVPVEGPLANPAFGDPGVWLAVRTTASGDDATRTELPWQFTPGWRPGSVMIHAEPTSPGSTGSRAAGAALACLTVGF
jgi:Cu-Zn family superoxide dismutase